MHSIVGIKKLKRSDLSKADRHNMRLLVNEENVDYSRSHLNRVLVGGKEALVKTVDKHIKSSSIERKIRDDAVYACEFMLTASPEFFDEAMRSGDSKKLDEWIADSMDWVEKTCGASNIMQAVLHMDETSPHLQIVAACVIKDTKTNKNKLTAKEWTASGAFSRMQTSYARAMGKYGLRRGEVDSPNKNQTIKQGRLKAVQQTAETAVELADKALQKTQAIDNQVNAVLAQQNIKLDKHSNTIAKVVKQQEALIKEQAAVIADQKTVIQKMQDLIKRLLEGASTNTPKQGKQPVDSGLDAETASNLFGTDNLEM